jgi:HEAT repeat protein
MATMNRGFLVSLALVVCASGCSLAGRGDTEKASVYSETNLDSLLREAASYEFGDSRVALLKIESIVFSPANSPKTRAQIARQLAGVLETDATFACKQAVCQHLALAGSGEQVRILAPLLSDEEMAEPARYALEGIPGSTSVASLAEALSQPGTVNKIGVMNSLGVKRDPAATTALAGILKGADIVEAVAAAANLGKIGGDQAAQALAAELGTPSPTLRRHVPDAYLKCADRFLAEGQAAKAAAMYKKLYAPGDISPSKIPAFHGLVRAEGVSRLPEVMQAIRSFSPQWRAAGLSAVRELPGRQVTRALAEELESQPPETQVLLLACLKDRGDGAAAKDVRRIATSDSVEAKVAAIDALGSIGGASEVLFLAEIAAGDSKRQSDAARASLIALSGKKVDSTILKLQSTADPEARVELIRCIGPRRIKGAASVLLKTAKDPDPAIRIAALESLAQVAGGGDMPKLIGLLLGAGSAAERKEAEKTLLAVSRGINDKNKRSAAVLKALQGVENDEDKSLLLSILASMGGQNALNAVKDALKDPSGEIRGGAVRSLANWENADPLPTLRELSEWEDDEALRVIALRGYIRQTGLPSGPAMEEKLAHYKHAMTFASYDDEKKQVLSGVAKVRSVEALDFAAKFIEEESLRDEASLAAVQIGRQIVDIHGPETLAVMDRILEVSDNEEARSGANFVKNPQTAKLKIERRRNREAAEKPLEPAAAGENRGGSNLEIGIQAPERGR